MIYPVETGKAGEVIRLRTLERVWIQGKLRMWGRWSYIGSGRAGNMFNRLLSEKITKTAISRVLVHLKKAGLNKNEMEAYFLDLLNSKYKSHLAFCTDSEALIIDRIIGENFIQYPGLKSVIQAHYYGRGNSKRKMAEDLNLVHPEWSYGTCRNRIEQWLSLAEFMLYRPMQEAFRVNGDSFYINKKTGTIG